MIKRIHRVSVFSNLNLNFKMDSDEDGFAKQGGDALDIGDQFDSDEEE